LESNPTAEKLLSMPQAEHTQRDIDSLEWHIVRPDGTPMPPDEFASVRALKEKRVVENVEMGIVKPDHTITWISVTAAPLPIEGHGVVITYGDITDRKRAEQELTESRALMDAVVENVPLMIFLKEATDLRFVIFNRAGEDLLGYDRKDLLGKNNLDLFPPEQAAHFMAKDREVLDGETGMLDIPEEPILTAKKGQRLLHTRKICIRGSDGTTKFLLGISEDITERKRAENALRESVELNRRIIASSRDCLKVLDLEGNLLSMSEGGQELLEIDDIGPYLNKSWVDFWKEEDREAVLEAIFKTLRGDVGSFSAYCETAKGTPKWWEVVITPIRKTDGKIENLLAVSRDITERKHTEEERTKFMSIIDSAPGAIVVLNADGTILYVNHAFAAISGLALNQIVGQYYEALVRKLYAYGDYGIQWDKVQTGESWTKSIPYKGRDGEFRLMDQSISPIRSRSGEIINYVVFSRDVTEEREMEIRARWADERLRLSIDGMVDGLTLWDVRTTSDGSIQEFVCSEANPAALMMLGKKRQDAVGHNVHELLKGAEDRDPQELFLRVHESGQSLTVNHLHFLKNNQRLIFTIHVWAIGTGVACHLRDATQQLELETQLRQAQKLEAVGSLAAGIAHEINTPIQFVGDNIRFLADSFTGLMNVLDQHRVCREKTASLLGEHEEFQQLRDLDKQLDVDYLKTEIPLAVEQSLEGVSRVSSIVRAMKDFSHIDEREMVLADVNQMLDTTLTVARNELKYVADIVKNLAPDLPAAECFRNDLNQVFLNLLINAAHAIQDVVGTDGDKGRGTITIATRRDGDSVVISISDTGAGIPEGIRDRIFEHFFTTKEVGKGTGQGLSIARSIIVEKHKGTITFDSVVGQGTTFHIGLPIARKEVEHAESQHPVRG
jgi:two-component system NtrC family sensor kinase